MINKIQNEYSLNEFLEISFNLSEGRKIPVLFMQIAYQCINQPSPGTYHNLPISRQN